MNREVGTIGVNSKGGRGEVNSTSAGATRTPESGTSLWRDAWRRLRRNRLAVASGIFLLALGLLALLAPVLPGLQDPAQQDLQLGATGPSRAHLFGTDVLGRDLLARVLHGGRVSMLVGLVATLVSFAVGVSYGAVSGYFGGRTDQLMMRGVDVLYSLPYMFLVILLMVYFSRSLVMLFVALGLVQWLTMARIVRGQVLSIKQQEYVEAARSMVPGPSPSSSGTWCPTPWARSSSTPRSPCRR